MEKILFFHHYFSIRRFPKYLGVIFVFLFSIQFFNAQSKSESQQEEAFISNSENIYIVGDAEIVVQNNNRKEVLNAQSRVVRDEGSKSLAKATKESEEVKKDLKRKVESPRKLQAEGISYFKNNGSSSTSFTFYYLQKTSCVLCQNTIDYSPVKVLKAFSNSIYSLTISSRDRNFEYFKLSENTIQSNWYSSVYSRPPPSIS